MQIFPFRTISLFSSSLASVIIATEEVEGQEEIILFRIENLNSFRPALYQSTTQTPPVAKAENELWLKYSLYIIAYNFYAVIYLNEIDLYRWGTWDCLIWLEKYDLVTFWDY